LTTEGAFGSTATHATLLLLAAGLAGVAVTMMPWQVLALLIALVAAVLALAVAKVLLRPVASVDIRDASRTMEDPRFDIARLAYYLGAATIGFLTIRPALTFAASDWIFFLSFGITCLVLLTYGVDREYRIPRAITIGVVLFSIGGLLSSYQAIGQLQSISIVVRLLYLTIVWFWLGTIVLQSRKHVEYATMAWVGSAALSAGGSILQYLYGDVIPGGTVIYGRMTGFTPHFNVLGGLAATAFVPALMLAVDASRRPARMLGTASVVLLGAGLLLSGSVGGFLAAGAATVFWLVIRGITLKTVVSLVSAGAVVFVLMSATGVTNSPDPFQRVKKVTSAEQAESGTGGTFYTRLDGYREAWTRIREQPLIGVGLDDASSREVLGSAIVHNMLINPWFSAGILGLVGIVLVVAGAALAGCRTVRHSPPDQRSFATALLASLVAFVVFGMGEPILFVRYGWFPAALLVVLRAHQLGAERAIVRRQLPHRPAVTFAGR
jgi:O-antigen ligase